MSKRIPNDARLEIDLRNNLIIFNGKDIFDYNDELLQILRTQCGSPFTSVAKNKGRTKIKQYGSYQGLYLYDIAFGCYSGLVHC